MSVKITSTKINAFTQYKLFRSLNADAYSGTLIETNATGEFTDASVVDKTLYHYGIECSNGTPESAYREPVVPYYHIADWGPFAALAAANMAQSGVPYFQGSLKNGLLVETGTTTNSMPNMLDNVGQTQLRAWGTAAGLVDPTFLTVRATANVVGAGMVFDGRLVSMRQSTLIGDMAFTTPAGSATSNVAGAELKKLADYLDNLSDGTNITTINGFRWRFKLVRSDELERNLGNFCTTTYSGPLFRDYVISSENGSCRSIFPGRDAVPGVDASWSSGAITINPLSETKVGWAFQGYFEYVGHD